VLLVAELNTVRMSLPSECLCFLGTGLNAIGKTHVKLGTFRGKIKLNATVFVGASLRTKNQ
jgi:hypothetical protein